MHPQLLPTCMASYIRQWLVAASSKNGVLPVAVDIASNTCVTRDSLPIFAPETVSGLGVDEAIWVDNGRNVEVELIDDRRHGRVSVFGEKLPREIFRSHGGNPLPRVNISVNNHSRLRTFATATPDVNAGQDTALDRGTESDDLRLSRVASLEVS